MLKLMDRVDEAYDRGQYVFVQDLRGQADTFFKYQGVLCDLVNIYRKYKLNMATRAEVIEYMRLNFVEAMRAGQRMCYFVGQEDFSFPKFNDDLNFPFADLFNWSVGR